jgi:predicted DCC family thiol-disulfide oxidoreductase YuxK
MLEKAVLIFDGSCGICSIGTEWIEKRAFQNVFEFVPSQSSNRLERFPKLNDQQCNQAMKLILADGRIFSGEEAVAEIAKRLKWRWWYAVVTFQPSRHLLPILYRWIAGHRLKISTLLKLKY